MSIGKRAIKSQKASITSEKTGAKKKTGTAKNLLQQQKKSTGSRIQVTATEKKLVELYRAADSDTKKAV